MKGHTTAFSLPWNKSFICCICKTHSDLKRCRACVRFKKVSCEFDYYVVHAGFAAVYSIFCFVACVSNLRALPGVDSASKSCIGSSMFWIALVSPGLDRGAG
jgi:hypothetical protein